MSHLTILPTVLRDADLLVRALGSLQLNPERGGAVIGFAGEAQPVDVHIRLEDGLRLGWREQRDGSLALVADLERLSRHRALPALLAEVTRTYAVHLALREAATLPPEARVDLAVSQPLRCPARPANPPFPVR